MFKYQINVETKYIQKPNIFVYHIFRYITISSGIRNSENNSNFYLVTNVTSSNFDLNQILAKIERVNQQSQNLLNFMMVTYLIY